jgi:YVTN family beta-propeller protein
MGAIVLGSAAMSTMGALPAAATDSGFLAYVAGGGSGVSIINTVTQKVDSTVGVGNTPSGVAVTPNGSAVYVANFGSNTVSIINTESKTVHATVDVGSDPSGVAI